MFSQVSFRCKQYANRFLNIKNPVKLSELNQHMYDSHGHTVLGLHKMGFTKATIQDFNAYVYGMMDYSGIHKSMNKNKKDAIIITNVAEQCAKHDIELRVFSNAPDQWVASTLASMSSDLKDIKTMSHITDNNLKPMRRTYDLVEYDLGMDRPIYFVDDKWINLSPVYNRPNWHPFFLTPSDQDAECIFVAKKLGIISDLSFLPKYIRACM